MKVAKLIEEYRAKIDIQDTDIYIAKDMIRKIRVRFEHYGMQGMYEDQSYIQWSEDLKVANKLRQSYIQFIADLESLE